MKEKFYLDKRVYIPNKKIGVSNSKNSKFNKIEKFNKMASCCENFCMKEKEDNPKTKVYWCKSIDKGCKYCNCPKINHS